eukprot:TRINITY_DN8319_c0_g1_i1.p2 TRINITY_DN8319_c0_g1~~TRINITY_DN8319_c0_g1_i1.p2  ORF type:complete len:299 (+),score=86.87 TRINITY_DN8319_c0_g1_i1:105-1001(+)
MATPAPSGTSTGTPPTSQASEPLAEEGETQPSTMATPTTNTTGSGGDNGGGGFWGFVNTLKEKGGSALETLTHDLDEFKTTISHDTTEAIHKAEQKATEVLAPALTGRTSDGDQRDVTPTGSAATPTTQATGNTEPSSGKIAPPPPVPLSQQQQQQQRQQQQQQQGAHSTLEDLGSKVESLTTSFWTMGTQFIQEVTASAGNGGGSGGEGGAGGGAAGTGGTSSFTSASDARLAALQRNERTYTEEPQEGEELDAYLAFSETLNLPLMTDEISRKWIDVDPLRVSSACLLSLSLSLSP